MRKIANLVLAFGLLTFGVASCDIFDPYDPGNPGGGGGGGNDTIIVKPHEQVEGDGWLRLVTADNGYTFYGIEADNGKKYEPTNYYFDHLMPDTRVHFKGRLLEDWNSTTGYGTLLEISELYEIR